MLTGIALPVDPAAATALAGCSADFAPARPQDKSEATLAVPNDVARWDPTKALGAGPVTWMEQAVYEGLVECDATANITPNAAESFEVNDDNAEFTFALREGTTFSDGSPADAAAGYRHLEIRPRPLEGIDRVRSAHLTPYGLASVEWTRDDGRFTLDLEVPASSVATVDLPGGSEPVTVACGSHRWTVALPHATPMPRTTH
jgi:hypothetical protein